MAARTPPPSLRNHPPTFQTTSSVLPQDLGRDLECVVAFGSVLSLSDTLSRSLSLNTHTHTRTHTHSLSPSLSLTLSLSLNDLECGVAFGPEPLDHLLKGSGR